MVRPPSRPSLIFFPVISSDMIGFKVKLYWHIFKVEVDVCALFGFCYLIYSPLAVSFASFLFLSPSVSLWQRCEVCPSLLLALLCSPQLSMHLSSTLLAQLPVTVFVQCLLCVLCALCVESVVMQDAAPAGMWLQAFSAIHCNCQDASVDVYKQN